jgi:hypothetical protein
MGCYPAWVARCCEAVARMLAAAADLGASATARRARLAVLHGLDEASTGLLELTGVGGVLARRLRDAGLGDPGVLSDADPQLVAAVRGISTRTAARLIEEAAGAVGWDEAAPELAPLVVMPSWPEGIDPYRLRRACDLRVVPDGDAFVVSGGLDPHRVGVTCDCADVAEWCKHRMAVALHRGDADMAVLVQRLDSPGGELDLVSMWFGR